MRNEKKGFSFLISHFSFRIRRRKSHMESRLSRWCDGLIEAGWLVAIITTPLFFNIHSDRVFEPDKLTLLRSIAVIMLAAWLVKFVDQHGWQARGRLSWRTADSIWKMPFILPVTLLAIVYIISTIFSVTPSVSWAGSYQRLQGTYTTLSYITIFAITIMTMRTRAQVRRVATAVIVTSIPVAFYGLLQHFDLDPLPWGGDVQARVAGHMGNAIFVAAYLIMAVPLTVARIISAFNNILNDEELATADVVRSSIYIFTLAIQLITIYWSGSRGPWLGLGVGMFAFVLIVLVSLRNAAEDKSRFRLRDVGKALLLVVVGSAVAFLVVSLLVNLLSGSGRFASLAGPMGSFVAFVVAIGLVMLAIFVMLAARRGWRWLWFSWMALSVLLGIWVVAFNLPAEVTAPYADRPVVGGVVETLAEWRSLPLVGRLGTVLESESGTGRVRVLIWEGALDLLLPHEPIQFPNGGRDTFNFLRPIFGYGPESMYVAYNRFYPPELATIEARNASPDRSHNETFDALVITGLAGFLVWQWLYLSVFYYGFKWLGVLRTKFERNLLIALWIGMGVLVAAVFVLWRGDIYFGVALPFGSIGGLVLYLVYYALFARLPEEEVRPFQWDRLLVTALIAAILAHYVEIHFGIAIASTRTHFFVYLALLFVVTYLMPRLAEAPAATPAPVVKGRRRGTAVTTTTIGYGTWGPLLLNTFMLALILGTMGYTFITYSQPPDVTSVEQITPGAIFHQSMLVNAKNDFAESPFIFLMFVLTWVLGSLLMVSEMVKDGELRFLSSVRQLAANRQSLIAIVFAVMGLGSFLLRLLLPLPASAGATSLLGQSLFWVWGALCLWAAFRLWRPSSPETSRLTAGAIALAGVVFTIPLIIAGGGVAGLIVGIVCAVLLYFLWDSSWNQSLGAAGVLAAVSLGVGLMYAFFQAFQLRFSILYGVLNPRPEDPALLQQFLVNEASRAATMLVYYYLFVVLLMLLSAFALAISRKPAVRQNGTTPAYVALAALVIVASAAIYFSNTRVVQADIVYKRGKFYDAQASRSGDPAAWENAIAIYEAAINRAPREDFYYLFLGRAFLELATLLTSSDPAETAVLLDEAQNRLQDAQQINPLNTDHTANLARLNTRWINLSQDETERAERVQDAENYYLDALALSPQNSVIRNEYGSLTMSIAQDCEEAIAIYRESLEIDPFYEDTYFRLADTLVNCGNQVAEEERDGLYQDAVSTLEEGLAINDGNARAWLRLGQIYQQLERYDDAVGAFESARAQDPQGRVAPGWNLDLLIARALFESGNTAQAEAMAQQALQTAPEEARPQINQLLSQITGNVPEAEPLPEQEVVEDFELDGTRPLADLPPAERNNYFQESPPFIIDANKEYEAIFHTEKGPIRLRLFTAEAPQTVNNFVYLASQGFYDGTTFHRVLEDFMAQGGDPSGTGAGGPGYRFADEVNNGLTFDRRGLLAMANAGPNTNGSQFFITFAPTPHLNGAHTIFGEVVEGDDVLSSLTFRDPNAGPDFTGDVIERVEIVESEE
jgi:cyclophilin family peptidyl-prolyl cis-trans isomerase/tetratricopeptide (TPR) repeat protein